jgi:hypothetical protein
MILRNIVLAAVAIAVMHGSCFAQGSRLMSGQAERNDYHFFFETVVEPGNPQVQGISGGIVNGNRLYRFMVDSRNRTYFGYDIGIDVLPDRETYRISFSQLTANPEDLRPLRRGGDTSAYTQLPAPDWGGPAVRIIRAGEVLALDLLANSSTGQKIVDYVTVKRTAEPPAKLGPLPRDFIQEPGQPRDFRAEDAFMVIEPKSMSLDGKSTPTGSVSASLPFFYFPNYGRFILSLTPRAELGFRKAGVIEGSNLSFTINGHDVSLVSSGRIVPGPGPFNVYVLHEPKWSGAGSARFAVGGANLQELPRTN